MCLRVIPHLWLDSEQATITPLEPSLIIGYRLRASSEKYQSKIQPGRDVYINTICLDQEVCILIGWSPAQAPQNLPGRFLIKQESPAYTGVVALQILIAPTNITFYDLPWVTSKTWNNSWNHPPPKLFGTKTSQNHSREPSTAGLLTSPHQKSSQTSDLPDLFPHPKTQPPLWLPWSVGRTNPWFQLKARRASSRADPNSHEDCFGLQTKTDWRSLLAFQCFSFHDVKAIWP